MEVTNKLLFRFLECKTTPEEDLAILDWLDSDPENQSILEKLDFQFNATVLHYSDDSTVAAPRKKNVAVRFFTYAAAAIVTLLICLASCFYQKEKTRSELENMTTHVYVPAGQRISLTLHDGTKIWLNSDSSIEYPVLFESDSRFVRLTGEAMFDVSSDSERPFRIETFAGEVKVLGTRFNVVADPITSRFSTALLEGKVHMTSLDDKEGIILSPGEKAELINGVLCKSMIDSSDEYLWTEGILSLQTASFTDLLSKMEKLYDVRFIIQCKEIPIVHCKGKIRISDGVEHALEILKMGTDFEYEKRKGSNEIYIR